jgi:hypothetical protein
MEEIKDELKAKSQKFQGFWKPTTCFKNKKCLFIYGDNDVNKGLGGQAVIRHCENALGIPTKKFPSYNTNSYYSDEEYKLNKHKINIAIRQIFEESKKYNVIYFPEDGLGTGLANLPKNAPRTLKYLNSMIAEYFGIIY